jgi:Family of unknown function (DUF6627)
MLKQVQTAFYAKPLALYLILALIAISCAAGPAEAMLVPASPGPAAAAPSPERTADLAKVQKVLEIKAVQQRLQDYGLTTEEALTRINSLSDEQLHEFAANTDAVQAGGDVLGTLLAVVLIALLVVLIIYLLEGRISVQRR